MTVSDESGGTELKLKRSRKGERKRFLSADEWKRVQTHYETDPNQIALRPLADLYGLSRQTVMIRARKERWQRQGAILADARKQLTQTAALAFAEAGKEAKKEIELQTRKALDDLSPWIETRKRKHIKSLVTLGEKGIDRVRKLMKSAGPCDAKNEAFTAKTADTWDNIIRRNLGMNDSGVSGGSLSVRLLTEGAAIEIQQG